MKTQTNTHTPDAVDTAAAAATGELQTIVIKHGGHTNTYAYIIIQAKSSICVCFCVAWCVCVQEREKFAKSNEKFIYFFIAEIEQENCSIGHLGCVIYAFDALFEIY